MNKWHLINWTGSYTDTEFSSASAVNLYLITGQHEIEDAVWERQKEQGQASVLTKLELSLALSCHTVQQSPFLTLMSSLWKQDSYFFWAFLSWTRTVVCFTTLVSWLFWVCKAKGKHQTYSIERREPYFCMYKVFRNLTRVNHFDWVFAMQSWVFKEENRSF